MRRFLIILLMLIFPLQVTLAAADLCCRDGTGARHEACVAEEGAAAQGSTPSHASSPIDAHCAMCLIASAGCLPSQLAVPAKPVVDRAAPGSTPTVLIASCPTARPERPQWRQPA